MRYYRKIIRIKAEDSPNVKYAQAELAAGLQPTNTVVIPGVLTWDLYKKRRETWDAIRQCIGLDAQFYEGAEVLLYPPAWLDRAHRLHVQIPTGIRRKAETMGVDAAEGGDSTVWTVIDELGILKQISIKTKDTSYIPGRTIALINEYKLNPEDVLFDRGGGGKQHVDALRAKGYNVRSVGFGEAVSPPMTDNKQIFSNKKVKEAGEERYIYRNRRAEMYGLTRNLLDPDYNEKGFAIPASYTELRRQLASLPLRYDGEGRLYLPPKDKPTPNYTGQTIKQILGCSPDAADSFVLAVFGMVAKPKRAVAGAIDISGALAS